jgi:hypothetical protein
MSIDKLKELADKYSLSDEIVEKRENDRLSFVEKFPLTKLKDLSIDQFVQGTDENSLCYWLEFKKIGFGIGGGNASKFGIYKTKNKEEIVYATGYGMNKTFLDDRAAKDYFSDLLNKILKALDYTRSDKIAKIRELEIPMWNMVLQKILAIYFPDKFLTIGSPTVLIKCAKELEIQNIELSSDNSILINYECKKIISDNPTFSNWSYEKIGSFIWDFFDGEEEKRNKKVSDKYFLVGAYWDGSNPADQTKRFLENGIWENGYEDKFLNDVKAVPEGSKIAIKAAFTREKTKSVMAIKARGIVSKNFGDGKKLEIQWENGFTPFEVDFSGGYWATIKEVKNKDHINSIWKSDQINDSKIHAKIIYAYLKSSLSHRKIQREILDEESPARGGGFLAMEILHGYEIEGDKKGILNKISFSDEYIKADGKYLEALNLLKEYYPELADEPNKIIDMKFPLNTILYGPPGTGKTYNTILRAAKIIENRNIESYKEALNIFKANLHNRIEFITFHQNYSYEDFIQGLRPDTKDDNDQLKFKKSDGVFKIISDRALSNIKESEKAPEEINQSKAFGEALESLKDQILESDQPIKINETAYFTAVEDDAFRYSGENWTLNEKGFNGFRMKYSDLERFFEEGVEERKEIKNLENISGLAKQHATYFIKAFELVKSLMPKKSVKAEITGKKNFVIIIDEINRANISRVFGELITLIEPDKRSHGSIPLEARLPSGDPFIVPSNLFIIGTMNTADKSIALLDIALRRRFEFEPMYPQYEIEDEEIYDVEILKKINEQIIKSKGHDFQIGHAYFMGENKDIVQRMNKKIIPLLLEYYMNDEKEVKGILQSAGLIIDENLWPLRITGKND